MGVLSTDRAGVLLPFYRKLGHNYLVMTKTPPSEDSPRPEPSESVEEPSEGAPGDRHQDPELPEEADEMPTPEDRGVEEPESSQVQETVVEEGNGGAEQADSGDEVPVEAEGQPSASPEEVSLFVAPPSETLAAPKQRRSLQGMGWKVMAVAGVVLLTAGFAAGLFFPEATIQQEVAATTAAPTTSTAATTTSTTSTVPDTTAATTPPTSSPTTTIVVEPVVVPPPDLVATDEPVADVAERLVPSVVHLEVQSEDVFEQGAGSGVIFDSNGYILTAAHVVETVVSGEAELTVRLSNGDRMPGEVVGTDPDSDVAVVKVERTGLVPAELALEDQPRAGQLVVAVGSPWGLESSVTSGVISAVDRIVEGKLLHQSDAVLYPGNSGGALADRYGRLIGINVSIFTDSTTLELVEFQGVGFAVPVDVAYRVAQALIAGEPVHTAFLGVSGRDTLGDAGVEIMEIFPGSGAETAGLQEGDIVVAVGGRPVTGITDLAARIRHLAPGDVIVLNVLRGEEELTLAATLLSRRDVLPDESEPAEEEGSEEE